MVFLQVMGIIFCIVLIGGILIYIADFLDWRSEVNERLESHYSHITRLESDYKNLERSVVTLYENKRCE